MESLLDIFFDILEIPLKKWDSLTFKNKGVWSIVLGIILILLLM